MKVQQYSVAKEFSKFLGTRFRCDGEHSGEALRDELLDLVRCYPRVEVSLDGMDCCSPSASEEAFGGLVRELGVEVDTLRCLTVVSKEAPHTAARVTLYMQEAAQRLRVTHLYK